MEVVCSFGDCRRGLGVHMRAPCLLSDFRQVSSVPCHSVWRAQPAVPVRETIMEEEVLGGGAGPTAGAHRWCGR